MDNIKDTLDKYKSIYDELDEKLSNKELIRVGEELKTIYKPTEEYLLRAVRLSLKDFIKNKDGISKTINFQEANELFTVFMDWLIMKGFNTDLINGVLDNDKEIIENKDNKQLISVIKLFDKIFDREGYRFFYDLYKIFVSVSNKFAVCYSRAVNNQKNKDDKNIN